jgi:hypothetical protein
MKEADHVGDPEPALSRILQGPLGRDSAADCGRAKIMTTRVQSATRELPLVASGFGVMLLSSLLGLALSLAVGHFTLNFSPLS